MSVLAQEVAASKFCFTCGAHKDIRDYSDKADEYDGKAAECRRCEECRELGRAHDGATKPRIYEIEGEGRTKAPVALWLDLKNLTMDRYMRRRPASGLSNTEWV